MRENYLLKYETRRFPHRLDSMSNQLTHRLLSSPFSSAFYYKTSSPRSFIQTRLHSAGSNASSACYHCAPTSECANSLCASQATNVKCSYSAPTSSSGEFMGTGSTMECTSLFLFVAAGNSHSLNVDYAGTEYVQSPHFTPERSGNDIKCTFRFPHVSTSLVE